MTFIIMSSGGDYYGPFEDLAEIELWLATDENEENVGDYCVEELSK